MVRNTSLYRSLAALRRVTMEQSQDDDSTYFVEGSPAYSPFPSLRSRRPRPSLTRPCAYTFHFDSYMQADYQKSSVEQRTYKTLLNTEQVNGTTKQTHLSPSPQSIPSRGLLLFRDP